LNSSTKRESFSLLKSLIALLLIVGCLWAAQWQYHRGVARHARNTVIETNSSMKPVPLSTVLSEPSAHEWQPVITDGTFDTSSQILLRNRYFEGVYGFELLTRFTNSAGQSFWVDCGWVKAGESATTQPELPPLPSGKVSLVGRLRLDSSLPQGSFFAVPVSKSDGLISKANAQSGMNASLSTFYVDLLSGSQPSLTPDVPAQLPELSDGPHMAYALQWVFFGGLVVYGRFLIRRDVLSREEL
jgi:cytochrome oxidase assembly protein ShyY1